LTAPSSSRIDPLADLAHPDVAKAYQQNNVDSLRGALRPGERLRVVAQANRKRFKMGLLGLTQDRLLYVETRIVRRPIIRSIPAQEIVDADIELEPLYGRLVLSLRDKTRVRFDLIRPKERVYPFLWRIREMIADRVTGADTP
jgi:hypothetical protein